MSDLFDLDRADDGHLFKVRVLNTGEERTDCALSLYRHRRCAAEVPVLCGFKAA